MTRKSFFKGNMNRVTGSATVVLLALGVLGSSQALAGIASTKHNLTPTGTGDNKFTPANSTSPEICVFCHTPHGADASAAVPLWNKTMATTTYTTYSSLGTSSLDGAMLPVGSISLACLSCHDGSQAMNTMINAPGSGLANADWANVSGWAGTTTAGKMTNSANKIAMLYESDSFLKNDHPISIQYGGGLASGTTVSLDTFRDPDFNAMQTASLNSSTVWWVDTAVGTAGTRQKTDIMLYSRTGDAFQSGSSTLASTTLQPYVECGSCHDPHVQDVSGSNPTFLRISNNGSAVCLACHDK